MPQKYIKNTGKRWTPQEINSLKSLARANTPTRVVGLKLGRSEDAVYTKDSELEINLNPHNRSPYNRRKR